MGSFEAGVGVVMVDGDGAAKGQDGLWGFKRKDWKLRCSSELRD
jgi:hypothetical protein